VLPSYEIRLSRPEGPSAQQQFGDLTVVTDGDVVLLTGRLDQSALHGVLERIRLLRWRLLDVRRARRLPGRTPLTPDGGGDPGRGHPR
jgi:hypothetical protein